MMVGWDKLASKRRPTNGASFRWAGGRQGGLVPPYPYFRSSSHVCRAITNSSSVFIARTVTGL